MRYLRLFGALVVVCAVGAMMASSAFALPSLLIGETKEGASSWTGKNVGETELLKKNGKKVNCTGTTIGEGSVEAKKPLGEFHIHFTGCKGSGFACTGEGETAETILSLGSWHLVYDTLKAGLTGSGVAILFLVGKVNFTCGGIVKIEVQAGGMVLCLILNPEALTKIFEFHCKKRAAEPFGPEETKYDNETGTWIAITPLLATENGTTEESVQLGLGTIEFKEDTLIMI